MDSTFKSPVGRSRSAAEEFTWTDCSRKITARNRSNSILCSPSSAVRSPFRTTNNLIFRTWSWSHPHRRKAGRIWFTSMSGSAKSRFSKIPTSSKRRSVWTRRRGCRPCGRFACCRASVQMSDATRPTPRFRVGRRSFAPRTDVSPRTPWAWPAMWTRARFRRAVVIVDWKIVCIAWRFTTAAWPKSHVQMVARQCFHRDQRHRDHSIGQTHRRANWPRCNAAV
jgi:hypothetical protein